ncbi:hypothetical protein IWZ01DRAFT_339205 [Phyllosticta capitalensis]
MAPLRPSPRRVFRSLRRPGHPSITRHHLDIVFSRATMTIRRRGPQHQQPVPRRRAGCAVLLLRSQSAPNDSQTSRLPKRPESCDRPPATFQKHHRPCRCCMADRPVGLLAPETLPKCHSIPQASGCYVSTLTSAALPLLIACTYCTCFHFYSRCIYYLTDLFAFSPFMRQYAPARAQRRCFMSAGICRSETRSEPFCCPKSKIAPFSPYYD